MSGARHWGRRRGARAGTGHARTQPRCFASRLVFIPLGKAAVAKAYGTRILWTERRDDLVVSPRRNPDASGPCDRLPSARRGAHWCEGQLPGWRASGKRVSSPSARRATAQPSKSSPPSSSKHPRRRSQRAHAIHDAFAGGEGNKGQRPRPVLRETYVDCFRPAERRLQWRPEVDAGRLNQASHRRTNGGTGLSRRGRR